MQVGEPNQFDSTVSYNRVDEQAATTVYANTRSMADDNTRGAEYLFVRLGYAGLNSNTTKLICFQMTLNIYWYTGAAPASQPIPCDMRVHLVETDWTPSTLTWDTKPTALSTDFLTFDVESDDVYPADNFVVNRRFYLQPTLATCYGIMVKFQSAPKITNIRYLAALTATTLGTLDVLQTPRVMY